MVKKGYGIPVPRITNGKIPDKVALVPDSDRKYLLSFSYYNDKLCEIDVLDKNRPKECLQVLKKVSRSYIGELREQNIDRIPIRNSGEYKKLYSCLPSKDTELFEHKVQGDGRIFYFTTCNRFYVVAILNNHLEINKVRR